MMSKMSGLFLLLILQCNHSTEPIDPDTINLTASFGIKLVFPKWSPDGSRLVSNVAENGQRFYTFSSEGSDLRLVVSTSGVYSVSPVDWSPDSKKILYVAYKPYEDTVWGGFWIYNLSDSTDKPFPIQGNQTGTGEAAWSPAGGWIAFLQSGSLYLVSDTGGAPIHKGQIIAPEGVYPTLCWSPDGAELAIAVDHVIGYRISDGQTRMIIHRSVLQQKDPNQDWTNRRLEFPAWSTDGRRIAFTHSKAYEQDNDNGIYIFSLADSSVTRFATGQYPTWSPDGNWIAYNYGDIWKKKTK